MNELKGFNIYFTGFMATGKSRIGEQLARLLEWPFVDTDRIIEEKQGCTVSEIFEKHGEKAFRQLEIETLAELSKEQNKVIALGGGALTQADAIGYIRNSGILVRLWAPVDVLSDRIGRKNNRPLMSGLDDHARRNKIEKMLKDREEYYSLADFAVKSCEEIPIEQIAKKIKTLVHAWQFRKVLVEAESHQYPIFIGRGIYGQLRNILEGLRLQNHDCLVVTDDRVGEAQETQLQQIQRQGNNARCFRFPHGEANKHLQNLNRLYTYMLRKGYTRKSVLLQFSGGVVGDMAGFAAATYQRGIPFIQIPTTLLSMVDSSVGGKVAVNHPLGKNMIGAFYQPHAVLIDLDVLRTLPKDEYLAGLAEVIKYGVIWDPELFALLENNVEDILRREPVILEKVVARCCAIKAEVVGQDEKETGIRAILNYGHTFGHAIEKLTNYQVYSHGIAVALGMRAAGRLSTIINLWTKEDEERQNRLLNLYGFPKHYIVNKDEAWSAMGIDKKADKGKRVFILPSKIGEVRIVSGIEREFIDQAWNVLGEV